MINSILTGDIEAFPSYSDIIMTFSDPTDESAYFETTLPRDESVLTTLLKRLQVSEDPEYMIPVRNYAAVADTILRKHVGTVYCPKDKVTAILQGIERDLTPDQEFPGKQPAPETFGDIYVYEYITLKHSCKINEALYPKGSTIKLTYKVGI